MTIFYRHHLKASKFVLSGSHHCRVSCLVTAQRLFSSGSGTNELRTLHTNASFLLIWRSYRNRSSLECLGRQIGAYPAGFIASALEQTWSKDRYQPLGLQIGNQFKFDDQLRCVSGTNQINKIHGVCLEKENIDSFHFHFFRTSA
jgi:hypothetical protein